MFGRNKPSAPAADRMRRAVERPAPPKSAFTPKVRVPRADRQAVYRQGTLVLADGEKFSDQEFGRERGSR